MFKLGLLAKKLFSYNQQKDGLFLILQNASPQSREYLFVEGDRLDQDLVKRIKAFHDMALQGMQDKDNLPGISFDIFSQQFDRFTGTSDRYDVKYHTDGKISIYTPILHQTTDNQIEKCETPEGKFDALIDFLNKAIPEIHNYRGQCTMDSHAAQAILDRENTHVYLEVYDVHDHEPRDRLLIRNPEDVPYDRLQVLYNAFQSNEKNAKYLGIKLGLGTFKELSQESGWLFPDRLATIECYWDNIYCRDKTVDERQQHSADADFSIIRSALSDMVGRALEKQRNQMSLSSISEEEPVTDGPIV